MKQLLIVNSKQTSVVDSTVGINAGQLYFKSDGSGITVGIGLPNSQGALIMPTINDDVYISEIITLPTPGKNWHASFEVPTPTDGTNYTVVLVKQGTMTNERYQYTVTDFVKAGEVKSAAQIAASLVKQLNDKVGQFGLTATANDATVSIQSSNHDAWTIKLGDGLFGMNITENPAEKPVGDKAYVEALVKYCAAGKGFNYLAEDGKEIYPGYPEVVEDLKPNDYGDDGESTDGYAIVNFHFATKRIAGKQLDEAIAQDIFIAVPVVCKDVLDLFKNL